MHMDVLSMCAPMHVVPMEARRWHKIFWNCRYRQLSVILWVVGTDLGSSAIRSDFQHWAIFLVPIITFNLHYYSMNLGQQELCVTKEEMLRPLSYHQWTLELEH